MMDRYNDICPILYADKFEIVVRWIDIMVSALYSICNAWSGAADLYADKVKWYDYLI